MDIGQAIKELRVKRGLTQLQLAERIGMSVNAVSTLELGKTYPPKATVEKLCEAFDVPTSYLLMSSIEEQDLPEEKRVLYSVLKSVRNELLDHQ